MNMIKVIVSTSDGVRDFEIESPEFRDNLDYDYEVIRGVLLRGLAQDHVLVLCGKCFRCITLADFTRMDNVFLCRFCYEQTHPEPPVSMLHLIENFIENHEDSSVTEDQRNRIAAILKESLS